MVKQILDIAYSIEPELVKLRRQIHKNPELAIQEIETARLVAIKLKELGLIVEENIGKTGVVALLRGKEIGKTVALRADMDALPIQEQTTHDYKSIKENIMHACGHDAHTAVLIGAATILSQIKDSIKGNVKFIFQPSEESPLGGAAEMITEGVLENPKVDAVIGLHVDPNLKAGIVGYREGAFYALGGGFEIEILGIGGHGALPHKSIDAILIASELIQTLQTIAASKIDPMEPFVMTIGTINGGSKANIIADKVTLSGTVRCFSKEIINNAAKFMEQIIKSITEAHGAKYSFKFVSGTSPLVNDKEMVNLVKDAAVENLGENNVTLVPQVLLGEDFVCYSQLVPSAFVSLGSGFDDRENYPLHHPKFDLNERALPIGAALLANSAINFLNSKKYLDNI